MGRLALALAVVVGALTLAGVAAAAPGGANVVRNEGCASNVFGTTCIVTKTVTSITTTPSGNVNYSTNGTVESTMTFVFGGSFSRNTEIHLHSQLKQGEIHTYVEHYDEATDYASATYRLHCVSGFDVHWAGEATQFSNYSYECTVL
jgi:hypothetical protein